MNIYLQIDNRIWSAERAAAEIADESYEMKEIRLVALLRFMGMKVHI